MGGQEIILDEEERSGLGDAEHADPYSSSKARQNESSKERFVSSILQIATKRARREHIKNQPEEVGKNAGLIQATRFVEQINDYKRSYS